MLICRQLLHYLEIRKHIFFSSISCLDHSNNSKFIVIIIIIVSVTMFVCKPPSCEEAQSRSEYRHWLQEIFNQVSFHQCLQAACSIRVHLSPGDGSEHTDRNAELKPTVLFRTTPTHQRITYTVLPQTFQYRISTMLSFKSYLGQFYQQKKRTADTNHKTHTC